MSEEDSFMHEIMSDRSKRNRPASYLRDVRHSSMQLHRFAEDQDLHARYSTGKLQHFLNAVLHHSKEFKEYHNIIM